MRKVERREEEKRMQRLCMDVTFPAWMSAVGKGKVAGGGQRHDETYSKGNTIAEPFSGSAVPLPAPTLPRS